MSDRLRCPSCGVPTIEDGPHLEDADPEEWTCDQSLTSGVDACPDAGDHGGRCPNQDMGGECPGVVV
jgi:hypothetical protein